MPNLTVLITENCKMCETADREGWWGTSQLTHCRKCHYTWNMNTKAAHCTHCHRHFTSPTGFDAHLHTGTDGRSIFHSDPQKKNTIFAKNEQGAWYKVMDPYKAHLLQNPHFSSSEDDSLDPFYPEYTERIEIEPFDQQGSINQSSSLSWMPKSIG